MRGRNRRRVDQAAVRAAAKGAAVRVVRVVSITAAFLAAVAALGFGGLQLKKWLTTSPTFAIEAIEFDGLVHAKDSELLRLSGVAVGQNIFDADVESTARLMSAHPWVKRVTVDRAYPHKLVVKVTEHVPAALADMGRLYFVSDLGKPFKRVTPGEVFDLPVISGLGRDEYVESAEDVEALFKEAVDALALYAELGLEAKWPVSEVRVEREEGFTFFCGKDAFAVRLGFKDYRDKFSRLEKVMGELKNRNARAEVIRLDNRARPGWVAVELAAN